MEQTPNIVMQCPRCRKEFPLDINYCEDCSVMLEPVELPHDPAGPAVRGSEAQTGSVALQEDRLDDVRIDNLRTDMEAGFVHTLLFELNSIRTRISRKEAELGRLLAAGPGAAAAADAAEADIAELLSRSAKIETVLERLRQKLEDEISGLNPLFESLEKPGLFGLFSASGRYYRMLSSQVRQKTGLLAAINSRVSGRKDRRLKVMAVAAVLVLVVSATAVVTWILASRNRASAPSRSVSGRPANTTMQAADIYALLEDIRTANLRKDWQLLESRYTRQYLNTGKKGEMMEQWRRFDYLSLQYRVEDIRMLPDRTEAVIAWGLDLRQQDTGRRSRSSVRLVSEFVIEDNMLRISAVRKAD